MNLQVQEQNDTLKEKIIQMLVYFVITKLNSLLG